MAHTCSTRRRRWLEDVDASSIDTRSVNAGSLNATGRLPWRTSAYAVTFPFSGHLWTRKLYAPCRKVPGAAGLSHAAAIATDVRRRYRRAGALQSVVARAAGPRLLPHTSAV